MTGVNDRVETRRTMFPNLKRKSLKRSIYTLYFDYMLIMAMISNYFEPVTIWFGFFVLFFIILAIYGKKIIIACSKHVVLIVASLLFLSISIYISGNQEFLLTNLLNIWMPTMLCISLSALAVSQKDNFKIFVVSKVKFLNIWWVFNLLLVIVQETGVPLLIKRQWIERNRFYQDLCCGMFGYNRTHELAFFACFILVCNVTHYKFTRKKSFLVYTIITEMVMLVCSYFNDNTAFFLLLPLTLVLYRVLSDTKNDLSFLKKYFGYIKYIAIIAIVIILLLQIPIIKQVYEDYILVRINAILFYRELGIAGSNERSAIIEFAFQNSSTWAFGKGFSSEILGEHMNYGFRHFGLSSMGIIIYLAGLWYYLLHSLLLSKCCNDLVLFKTQKSYSISLIISFVFIIGISFYSPIMTSYASMFWISMIFAFI